MLSYRLGLVGLLTLSTLGISMVSCSSADFSPSSGVIPDTNVTVDSSEDTATDTAAADTKPEVEADPCSVGSAGWLCVVVDLDRAEAPSYDEAGRAGVTALDGKGNLVMYIFEQDPGTYLPLPGLAVPKFTRFQLVTDLDVALYKKSAFFARDLDPKKKYWVYVTFQDLPAADRDPGGNPFLPKVGDFITAPKYFAKATGGATRDFISLSVDTSRVTRVDAVLKPLRRVNVSLSIDLPLKEPLSLLKTTRDGLSIYAVFDKSGVVDGIDFANCVQVPLDGTVATEFLTTATGERGIRSALFDREVKLADGEYPGIGSLENVNPSTAADPLLIAKNRWAAKANVIYRSVSKPDKVPSLPPDTFNCPKG